MKTVPMEMPYYDGIIPLSEQLKQPPAIRDTDVTHDRLLMELIALNAEQMTLYLEDLILENPFIDLEYSNEQLTNALERTAQVQTSQRIIQTQTLESYLFEQIMLYRQTPIRDVMIQLVNLLDDYGYLPYTVSELAQRLEADEIVVLDAVTLFKMLEPAGVGAYNLQEAYLLQIEQDASAPALAYYIVEAYFDALNQQALDTVAEAMDIRIDEVQEVVDYVLTLTGTPAALFERGESVIERVPDVTLENVDGYWQLRYNRQYYPRLVFNADYFNEMVAYDDPEVAHFIQGKDIQYEQLSRALAIREEWLMYIIQGVVIAQRGVFSQDGEVLESLTVRELAHSLNVPAAIVYRALMNKSLAFKEHVYSLSDFINQTRSLDRTGYSAQMIKDRLQALLAEHGEEMTDEAASEALALEGIDVDKDVIHSYRQNLD